MMAKARDPEGDAAFDAYFYWLCDGSMSFGNMAGGGGGGYSSAGWGGADPNWAAGQIYYSNVKFYGYTDYSKTGAYISKYDGHIASFDEYYANKIAPDLAKFATEWNDRKLAEARAAIMNAYNSKLIAGPGITLEDGPGWEAIKMLWNLKIIGGSIPDNISFDLTLGSVFGIGESTTFSINILTRGDAGFYLTRTEQLRGGAEVDWGLNINFGYYTGDPLNINKSSLLGPVRSVSGGWIYSGNISTGYSNSNFGTPSWITVGTGVGLTGGGSYGWGKTYKGWLDY